MGRELRLRQLAKPLDKARKDPKVDKAVLFVEDLFGRKMKNRDTKILLVTDKNRSECIYALKYDPEYFVSNRIKLVFALYMLPRMLSLFNRETAKWYFSKKDNIGFADVLKTVNVNIRHPIRKSIKEVIGEENTKLHERMLGAAHRTGGFYLHSERMVIVREEPSPMLVHELIHAEDHDIDKEDAIWKIISEGRACYGEELYGRIESGEDLDTLQILMDAKGESLFGSDGIIGKKLSTFWNGLDRKEVRELAVNAIFDSLDELMAANWNRQKNYIPFKIVIAELAHILNDPYAAFRITTEKQPRTKEELKNFKEFYKKEIEEYKGKN